MLILKLCYQLQPLGICSIVRSPNSSSAVHGIAYKIPLQHCPAVFQSLDDHEGPTYYRKQLKVEL